MRRSDFLRGSVAVLAGAAASALGAGQSDDGCAAELERERQGGEFVAHWLADLLDAVDGQLDAATRASLIAACGVACYRRHAFKQRIAEAGAGSVEKLVAAYSENFEAWRAEDGVHIRYGEVSRGCYCPAARVRPPRPGDPHCECTRATHRTVFETALGRPVEVDILETVRRGGRTCHFVARL